MNNEPIEIVDSFSFMSKTNEIWDSHNANDIEKIHLEYIKSVLSVSKNTNTAMVYFETGRLPMRTLKLLRIFNFWFKLFQSKNCILKSRHVMLYDECEHTISLSKNPVRNIKSKLFEIWLGQVCCVKAYVYFKLFSTYEQGITDNFI